MSKLSTRNLFAAIALSSALVAVSGCSTGSGRSVGAYVDDTVITTTVKTRFAEAKEVDATSISVETINGTVMLRGIAKNAQEKTQAEMIARSVEGVRSVNNRIDISS